MEDLFNNAEEKDDGKIEIIEDDDDISIVDVVTNPANALSIIQSTFSSPSAFFRNLCPFVIIDTNKPIVLKQVDKK